MLVQYDQAEAVTASSWKLSLAKVLSSRYLDLAILCLVLCDLACVALESSIDLNVACIGSSVVPMSPASLVKLAEAEESPLALSLSSSTRRGVTSQPLLQAGASSHVGRSYHVGSAVTRHREEEAPMSLICENKHGPNAERIMETSHKISIAILAVFFIEILLKIYVHPRTFFSSSWEILDFVVVTVSLVLDCFEQTFEEVLSAIILLRLWRCVRIVHGFIEVMDSDKEMIEKMEQELRELNEECVKLEKELG